MQPTIFLSFLYSVTVTVAKRSIALMEDQEIIELYFARDERAIAETAGKYGRKLNGIAYNVTRNYEDAEECVNDTYNATWNSIPPARPTHFFAYIAKIARNLALDLYDKAHAAKRSADVVELTDELINCISGSDEFEKRSDSAAITEVINRFLAGSAADMRKVFVRRYFYMDSVKDIAKGYAMSESKVKSILFRMRAGLAKELKEAQVWI